VRFMLLQRKQRRSLDGEQNSVLRRCAATSGIGPARIHMGIAPLLQSPMGQRKGLAMGQQLIMLCIMGRQS
jgi:hypothetical protein